MSKKKFKRIFYGLHEPLLVFRWATTARQGALVCRALPLLKLLRNVEGPRDLDLLDLPQRILVCQIMNLVPLLEDYRLLVPATQADSLEFGMKALRRNGFMLCSGAGIDVLKSAGPVTWEQHQGRFNCKVGGDTLLFRVAVGASSAVPAFHTLWIDPQEVCRRTYEYLKVQSHGDTTSRSVP